MAGDVVSDYEDELPPPDIMGGNQVKSKFVKIVEDMERGIGICLFILLAPPFICLFSPFWLVGWAYRKRKEKSK